MTPHEFSDFVDRLIAKSTAQGFSDLAQALQEARNLGSSGLEVIGAIRTIIVKNAGTVAFLTSREEGDQAIKYVDRAYGRI